MAVKIVTDSACDLPPEVAADLGVTIVPIRVNLGRNSFRDGIDLRPGEAAQKIAAAGALPTTSQPPPYEFEKVFATFLEQGHEVLCLTLSSALSGTYHSALIAAGEFPSGGLQILDSQLVSAGLGLLVTGAARLAAQGCSLAQVVEFVQDKIRKIRMFAILDTVEPIVRGGRLNLFARHAAGREGIKLIFALNGKGGVQILERVRGRRRSLDRLVELMTAQPLEEAAVVHVECPGEARQVAEQIAKESGASVQNVWAAGGSVSTYAGRGAIIVAG